MLVGELALDAVVHGTARRRIREALAGTAEAAEIGALVRGLVT